LVTRGAAQNPQPGRAVRGDRGLFIKWATSFTSAGGTDWCGEVFATKELSFEPKKTRNFGG